MTDLAAQPLRGVRVVELAQWVAGPAVGGLMADWGADVIKVEAPTGDPQRALFQSTGITKPLPNPPFAQDNRGKRSVVLDLRSEDGRERLDELLITADVFVTNLRPGALERLDLDPSDVVKRFPELIVAAQTGYGSVGPERDTPGYDIGAYLARSGIARRYSPDPEPPLFIRSGVGDHATALATLTGILAKLYERSGTGQGGLVETSLFQTGMYTASWDLSLQRTFGKLAPTPHRTESDGALVNSYAASDGQWFFLIGLETMRHLPSVCHAIGQPDLLNDEDFASAAAARDNGPRLVAILSEAFGREPLAYWRQRFSEHDVWWAPCQTMEQVMDDPQAAALGSFHRTLGPDDPREAMHTVASPVWFDRQGAPPPRPVPALGQHTEEVLRELDKLDP